MKSKSTEINFYQLTKISLEKALPKLLLKILSGGGRAVLIASNDEEVKSLDSMLWTFSTNKVVPHGTKNTPFPANQPVYITSKEENPNGADFLVMVSGATADFVNGFSKCLDIFDGNNDNDVNSARERWSRYKKGKNCKLTYWKQDEKGFWEQEE